MTAAKPPIWDSTKLAWSDTGRTFAALPVPALIGLVIVSALTIGQDLAIPQQQPSQGIRAAPVVMVFLVAMLQALLVTPYLIALHRFVILGERSAGYAFTPAAPRFRRYFGWSLALSVLALLPAVLPVLVTSDSLLSLAMLVGLIMVFFFIAVRIILVFPALAVDAPDAGMVSAWRGSSGYAWRTFWILVLALVPWIIIIAVAAVIGVLTGAISETPLPFGGLMITGSVVQAALVVLGYTLVFAIASRLYESVGARSRPAPVKDKRYRERHRR